MGPERAFRLYLAFCIFALYRLHFAPISRCSRRGSGGAGFCLALPVRSCGHGCNVQSMCNVRLESAGRRRGARRGENERAAECDRSARARQMPDSDSGSGSGNQWQPRPRSYAICHPSDICFRARGSQCCALSDVGHLPFQIPIEFDKSEGSRDVGASHARPCSRAYMIHLCCFATANLPCYAVQARISCLDLCRQIS